MRHIRIALLLLSIVAAFPAAALAQEEEKPTKFTADFGYVKTDGNSNVTTLSGADKLERKSGRWLFTQEAGAVWGQTDGVESAGRYNFLLRGDRQLAERLTAFGLASWKRNTFAGISHQFDEGLGLSWKAIAQNGHTLNLEGAVGFVQREPTVGPDENFVSARPGLAYTYDFSEKSQFSANGVYNVNLEDTDNGDGEAHFALTAPVARALALKLGYDMFYRNRPLPGLEKLDTTFIVGLQVVL
jgi:putative salt-induced outer membrane protein